MNIPDCYEAFAQEEARQARADRKRNRYCCFCNDPIAEGEIFYRLPYAFDDHLVCKSCEYEINSSLSIMGEEGED